MLIQDSFYCCSGGVQNENVFYLLSKAKFKCSKKLNKKVQRFDLLWI